MDVNAASGDAHPERAIVFEDDSHVGRLAEDAHVRKHAVIYEVVRADTVSAILFTLIFAPLSFFDFADHGGDDNVTGQVHAGSTQGLDCLAVADEGPLHVVDAEAENHAIFDDSAGLVS